MLVCVIAMLHFKSEDRYLSNGDNSGKTTYEKLLPSVALSWKIFPDLMTYASYALGLKHQHLPKWLILMVATMY